MKLVYKTLHKKQAFLHAMLILLLFLSLLSLQITFTVFTKGQNMAERIDKMDVATTNIFYKEYDDEIKDFLQEYKEDGNLDFTYEESLVWPYGVFSTSWMQETSPIYLEGFVKSAAHYHNWKSKAFSTGKRGRLSATGWSRRWRNIDGKDAYYGATSYPT